MKSIQPVSVWINGSNQQAVLLDAYVTNDNLSSQATFFWGIYSADAENNPINVLSSGLLSMFGEDYTNWNADPDINEAAYSWIAEQLNLTII